MSEAEPQPAVPPPGPPFQFSLRTLLLLFVVLGSSLAVFGAWGIVVFGLAVGLAVFVREVKSLWSLMHLVLVCALPDVSYWRCCCPRIETARETAPRGHCANNLKQIAAALQDYHQVNGCFPPAYIADKNGKPMHSWRVLILPYLDHDDLYKAYDFSEPWDGPKNKKLLAIRLPDVCLPERPHRSARQALPRQAMSPWWDRTPLGRARSRGSLTDFGKDASNTIMLVEVANSGISWAEPRDLSLDTLGAADGKSPALALSSDHGRREEFFFTYDHAAGVNVAMADGSVRFLRTGNRSPEDLRKLLQIGGFKEEEIVDNSTAAATELAQHRRPGRVAAFGRHAADPRGAEQEKIAGPAAVNQSSARWLDLGAAGRIVGRS